MKTLLRATVLLATLGGCAGDAISLPPPPPNGISALSVAVSSNAAMQRSGSAHLTVTVQRPGSFVAPVELSVSGLGTGVSATFAPATILESANTSVLTLTASPSAATGTYFVTLEARAGSKASSMRFLVSVTP
jgi:hypothetical protein